MEARRFRPREVDEDLGIQYEDMEQQNESYIVGMWTFLVTEIMFFGALFLAYLTYRTLYPSVFMAAHHELDVRLGAINTVVLLTSSFKRPPIVQQVSSSVPLRQFAA